MPDIQGGGTRPPDDRNLLDWMKWQPGTQNTQSGRTPPEKPVPHAAEVPTESFAADAATTQFVAAAEPTQRIFTPKPTLSTIAPEVTPPPTQPTPTVRAWSPYGEPSPYPPPAPPPWPGAPAPRRADRFPIIVGAMVVVILLAIGVGTWALTIGPLKDWGRSDSNVAAGGTGSGTVTVCAITPTMTPRSVSLTPSGLAVTVTATSSCADGDVLSNSATQVAVSAPSGLVASGSFDFSSTPIAIPGSGTAGRDITMTFPSGSYFGLPGPGVAGMSVSVNPVGTATTQELPAASASAPVSASPSQTYVPAGTDTDQAVVQSLRAQAAADRTEILAAGNNTWVAQLSSKQPGLVADGKTWTNQDILDEFASNYQRFSGARLLWSDDWPVFSSSGWWVTITSQTFPSGQAAVSWCAQQGFDRDHCIGKLISSTAGPAGTTVYLP